MLESRFWRLGFAWDQDSTCGVVCKCGESLFISDSKIFICPRCGRDIERVSIVIDFQD